MLNKSIPSIFFGLLLVATYSPFANAQNPANAAKDTRYLALGDSLAFGLNPLIQPPDLSKYIGYPKIVSQVLHLKVANASCPGETSGTFTGASAVYLAGYDCAPLESDGGLFVPYNGAPNQLAYAVNYLEANPNPKLVTINIGVNDIGVLQAECTAKTPANLAAITLCEETGLPGVLAAFGQNLTTIFSQIRGVGYLGPIAALNAYAFNYTDSQQIEAFSALNQVISAVSAHFGVTVVDEYGAFELASAAFGEDPCKAGLLLKLPNGTCDTHPSLAGENLLAAEVLYELPGKIK